MKFTKDQIAKAMEWKTMGLYWHEIANRLGCLEREIGAAVRAAKVHGFDAWELTPTKGK